MIRWLQIAVLCLLTACASASSLPHVHEEPNAGGMPALDRGEMPDKDGSELRSSALAHYAKGDYVRALRYGYWAAQTIPTDVRLRLLLGIVYDGGFNRPDLALPEYRRALSLKPERRFREQLEHRVHYLNRRLLQDSARSSLLNKSDSPLSENWLAVYPLALHGPRQPDPGVEIGLLDWVLDDVKERSTSLHVDPFTAWIVAQVYREIADSPTPQGFARWCGAGLVLTGHLSDLGYNRYRMRVDLLASTGETVHSSDPFVIETMSPDSAYSLVMDQVATALLLSAKDNSTAPPIVNPAALPLYSQGFARYLSGQVMEADANIRDASLLNGPSALLETRLRWAESDLLGNLEGASLLDEYHRLLNLPDPHRIVRNRLIQGHRLGSPAATGLTGKETDNPYKPPQSELSTP